MCGILAAYSDRPFNLQKLEKAFHEVGTRGLHSTGVSWLSEEGEIITNIQNVPYYEYKLPPVITKGAVIHCRYSTSNIAYPQPIKGKDKSIVHNGVITQAPPEQWEDLTNGNRCDSALLMNTENHPLIEFPDASIAAIELTKHGLDFYRNEQRPLYFYKGHRFTIVASTKRALEEYDAVECSPCVNYSTYKHWELMREPKTDLQHGRV